MSNPLHPVADPASTRPSQPPIGRTRVMRRQPVHLDGLACEQPEFGLVALRGPHDPDPSLAVVSGRVTELDGTPEETFDLIDTFLAAHLFHDASAAQTAMGTPDLDVARMLCSFEVPRADVTRVVAGLSPAKLARAVALLSPPELMAAAAKLRVRRTPANQAHVTNRLDDPILLAADAATAVAYGFRELETTVPVLADAASNAAALLIGSQVAAAGALTQCSVEEAYELQLGMRGLTTYAETISLYGTEAVFLDGDDTPWSKALLVSAYASRGLKVRVTSGAGSEVLMGEAEGKSMLYLEARCVALARAIGVQGVQNGGIDGASVAGSVPEGMKGLLAENVMVMARDLESCSGNDTLVSESDIRRTAHSMPLILAGSDFIFSGFGSVTKYDNMFGPSNFNGDDIDDFLVLQRDWGVDGGLRPVADPSLRAVRHRAAQAVQAVYRFLDLADYDDAHVEAVVDAHGSRDLPAGAPNVVGAAAIAIRQRGITALDIAAALAETGFSIEAQRILDMLKERVIGDYLQPAAIFDESMQVLSALTDPNDYRGPGTGYRISDQRRAEIAGLPQALSVPQILADQADHATPGALTDVEPAQPGSDARDVVIGISPAFGTRLWLATSGLSVLSILDEVCAGLEEEGCSARIVRIRDTIDLGLIGLRAARLAGSGIGVGLQAKGTVLIHQRGLAPLQNLELLSMAPLIDHAMYRRIGQNAGRYAKGSAPLPMRNAYTEHAITARYHAKTVALVAVERQECQPSSPPMLIERVSR